MFIIQTHKNKILLICCFFFLENPREIEALMNKKKKPLRKNKDPSKILNITELKQQPKLS